jgi:hypothetical protein
MEEADRGGISTMLAADAELEVGPGTATALHGDAHDLPDARLVDGGERRAVDDLLLDVARDDPTLDVIAGEADSSLGEVVGAEREEVRVVGDAIGEQVQTSSVNIISGASGPNFAREVTCNSARLSSPKLALTRVVPGSTARANSTSPACNPRSRIDRPRRNRVHGCCNHVHVGREARPRSVIVVVAPRLDVRTGNCDRRWFLLNRHATLLWVAVDCLSP